MGAGNHRRTRKGKEQGPRRRERGHHSGHQDPHARRACHDGWTSAAPPPADAARAPGAHAPNTRRRSTNRTPYRPHRHTPTSHRKPHRGWRAHLHGESGLHPQRKPLGSPPRSPPPCPHRQATTPATTRATSQAPEEDEGTATAPRARDPDPQRTRDHGTGAEGGQPHGHLPNPPARAAHPDPHSTDPASHPHLTAPPRDQPATLRHALRTTTRARLTSTDPPQHNTRQHGSPHRSAPQCNAPQQGTPKYNTPQHDATRRGTERHPTARHGATRRGPAGRTASQHGPARRSTAKHGTTQHGAPQHTTTPKQGTLTEGLTESSHRTPRKEPHQPATHQQGATARPATTVVVHPHKLPPEGKNRHRGGERTRLTQGHTKPPCATAQPAVPEPNPAGRGAEPNGYITHPTHGAGARPGNTQPPTATRETTLNANQCVRQPREGRGRNRQTPPPKKNRGGARERPTATKPPTNTTRGGKIPHPDSTEDRTPQRGTGGPRSQNRQHQTGSSGPREKGQPKQADTHHAGTGKKNKQRSPDEKGWGDRDHETLDRGN